MLFWNAIKNWLGQSKQKPQPIFNKVRIDKDPWVIEAWEGLLPLSNLRYLVTLRHLRPITDQDIPYKHFKEATHQIAIWCYFEQNNKKISRTLYNRQLNLGYWRLDHFETTIDRWRNPAEYKAICLSLDNCGKAVLRSLLKELEDCKDIKMLTASRLTENYWNITIANEIQKCPGIHKPIEQNSKGLSDGNYFWLDDSDQWSSG